MRLVAWFVLAAVALGQTAAEKRIEDLDFLATELASRHANLFHAQSRETWIAKVEAVRKELLALDDIDAQLSMLELTAGVGDAHTYLRADINASPLPLGLVRFDDGLFITVAVKGQDGIVGAEVKAIGGVAVDKCLEAAGQLISHENAALRDLIAPQWLTSPPALKRLGMAKTRDAATFTVAKDGKTFDVDLSPLAADTRPEWVRLPDFSKKTPPIAYRDVRTHYWTRFADDARTTLYVAYNTCAESPKLSFASFSEQLFKVVDQYEPKKIVVDLRNNGGGASLIARPLVDGLKRREAYHEKGRLFVVIGPQTQSSAVINAIEIKRAAKALLIGRPTGGKPNSYGEVKTFKLPNSGLTVGVATKLFRWDDDADPPSLMPDISAPLTSAAWFSGVDPAMDVVRDYAVKNRK